MDDLTPHAPRRPRRRPRAAVAALAALGTVALAACSPTGDTGSTSPGADGGAGGGAGATGGTVTLVSHDSFAISDALVSRFEADTGFDLEVLPSGDAGQMVNKLVLTGDDPLGDAVFGIDNTFASRAVEEGVLEPYASPAAPASAADYALADPAAAEALTPVDWGDVCVNVDDVWFADQGLEPPATLDDLRDPAYRDLFVTSGAASSSPGFAFLLATIGRYGEDGWQDYWRDLLANGTKVVSGWEDAYTVDFSASGGDRPIVLSYNSSPPFTIPEGGTEPTTSALLDTCFRQVEYAGVLRGTDNPDGARALIDFLVGARFQRALPESMYVFPVDDGVRLPRLWARWAEPAPDPVEVDPAAIAENRADWIRSWSDVTSG